MNVVEWRKNIRIEWHLNSYENRIKIELITEFYALNAHGSVSIFTDTLPTDQEIVIKQFSTLWWLLFEETRHLVDFCIWSNNNKGFNNYLWINKVSEFALLFGNKVLRPLTIFCNTDWSMLSNINVSLSFVELPDVLHFANSKPMMKNVKY